jgi:TM2 domain-containing membrane protein YozV
MACFKAIEVFPAFRFTPEITTRLVVIFCVLLSFLGKADQAEIANIKLADSCTVIVDVCELEAAQRPNPIFQLFKTKQKKNKKITAAILAFPFPFGIVGLHRIYLGTAPHVPVVYIGTLGGALGILPFIDFCVLALDKDIDRFIENKKVLMWVDENKKPQK